MDPVEVLKDLVKIDTRNPPGNTEEAVEYIERLFSSYSTRVYDAGDGKMNIVIEIAAGRPCLMLTSHLDTVPSDDSLLNPVIVDGKLYGRGSCDAKASVAAMISAALQVKPECGLKLAFTADEEVGGSKGLGYVFGRERADAVLIGEPTGIDSVGVLQAAVLAVDITFRSSSGHTAQRSAKDGAIYKAAEYVIVKVNEFSKLGGNYSAYRNFVEDLGFEFVIKSWEAVFNPAIVEGGVKRNVVAGRCTIKADVRFAPWIPIDEIRHLLESDAEFRVEGFLRPYGILCDAVKTDADVKMLSLLRDVASKYCEKPKAVFSLGVGDSRHVRKYGVPAFYYGPSGGDIHGDDEFVYVDELRKFVEVYVEIVKRFPEVFRTS